MTVNKFYITTSIAYTNSKPHIGFVLELIQADALARWEKLKGEDVFFLTGTDEHGIKNQRAAEKAGISSQEFVDKHAEKFEALMKQFNISNNYFIRTSYKKIHYPTAQAIWLLLEKNGDLYKKKYSGYYCAGCESFKTAKDLEDGKCPLHGCKPEIVEEENWFFALSKYSKQLEKLVESGKFKILPKTRKNEILSVIKQGLEDVSFSRSTDNLKWGIPVPGDDGQVMYVWCDALTNYLSGAGYSSNKKVFKELWPANIHLVGKDIIRFHCALWPAMLLSAGLKLPKAVYVHGFITMDGRKMSKTMGNVVDPVEQQKTYGTDKLRYFLLREVPSDEDGDYSEGALVKRTDSDLANGLGNLVNRALVMTEKYFDGSKPNGVVDKELEKFVLSTKKKVEGKVDNFELHHALEELWRLVDKANQYINDKKPWELKGDEQKNVIYNLLETIRCIAILTWPFIPESSEKIFTALGAKGISLNKLKFASVKGKVVRKGLLFKRVLD
jgi:methionyl-tRNA synthetase